MQGFRVTFFTQEGRHHGSMQMHVWPTEAAKSLDITSITMAVDVQGIGRDGRLHSAHLIELPDQPVEVTMALSPPQRDALLARLEEEKANIFYVKTPMEFGVSGRPADE